MTEKFIHQAYRELALLRLLRDEAEHHRLSTIDLERRISISEWRIRKLEWAAFYARV